jgi:hypothetical protein
MGWFAQDAAVRTQYDKAVAGAHIFATIQAHKGFKSLVNNLAPFSSAEALIRDIDERLSATDSAHGTLSVNGMGGMGGGLFHERNYLAKLATSLYLCSFPPNSLPGSAEVHQTALNYQRYKKLPLGIVINNLILEWHLKQTTQTSAAIERAMAEADRRSQAEATNRAIAETQAVQARQTQKEIISRNARQVAAIQAEKAAAKVDAKVREIFQAISLNNGFVDIVAEVLEKDFKLLTDLKAAMAWPNGETIVELITVLNVMVGNSSKVCSAVIAADHSFNETLNAIREAQTARLDAAKGIAEKALSSAGAIVLGPLGAYLGSAVGAALTAVVATATSVVKEKVKYNDRAELISALAADGLTAGSNYATTYAQGKISDATSSAPGSIIGAATSGARITSTVDADKLVSNTKQIVAIKRGIADKVFTFITGPGVTTDNIPGKKQQLEILASTQDATQDKVIEHVNSAFTNLWKSELEKALASVSSGNATELMRLFVEMGNEDPTVTAANRGAVLGGGNYGSNEKQFLRFCLLKIFPVVQSEIITTKLEARGLEEGTASAEFLRDVKTLCQYFAHSFKLALEEQFVVGPTGQPSKRLNKQDGKDLETVYEIYLWSLCYKINGTDKPPKAVISRLVTLGVMGLWNQGLSQASNALSNLNIFSTSKKRMAADGRLDIYNAGKLRWSSGTENEMNELRAFSEKVDQYISGHLAKLYTGEETAGPVLQRISGFAREAWTKRPV